MEDIEQPLDASSGSSPAEQRLHFTASVRSDLLETAKWALFLSVLLFIILGMVAIASLFVMTTGGGGFVAAIFMMAFYGLLIFFPAWYYYKFSALTRQALHFDDNAALDEGFAYLKRFYLFIGILVIVLIGLYFLMVIFALIFMGSVSNPFLTD